MAVGKAFGVVVVVLEDGQQVEVATFRNDGAYVDGRHPTSVSFASVVEDVERRDFTINALLLDGCDGRVVDHVGGIADLERRLLRTVGDAARRFQEDHLRILRGLRFAARLDLHIEETTWQALCAGTLAGVSSERIMQEWEKALSGPGIIRWLELLASSGHLCALYPPGQTPSPLARKIIGEALERCPIGASMAVRQALWLHTTPLPIVAAWQDGLPGSRRRQELVRWLMAQPTPAEVATWSPSRRRRLAQHEYSKDLMMFWKGCSPDAPGLAEMVAQVAEEERFGTWKPLICARDLIALGCPPGPRLGRLLTELEDAQLEKSFTTREEGLILARKRLDAPDAGENSH